jgi:hypothetical protein
MNEQETLYYCSATIAYLTTTQRARNSQALNDFVSTNRTVCSSETLLIFYQILRHYMGGDRLSLFFFSWDVVRLCPLGTSAANWPIVPAPDDRRWMWSSLWNENRQGSWSTGREPVPAPLCQTQIPHDFTWDLTRAVAVGSQRLTAWAMARPS